MWFLVMQLLKYCDTSPDFESDEEFNFQGENFIRYHTYQPTDTERRDLIPIIPRRFQTSKIVSRGIYYVFLFGKRQASLQQGQSFFR